MMMSLRMFRVIRVQQVGRSSVRSFARSRGKPAPPPPARAKEPADPWQEVKDPSGQSYWWNSQTNETTALGAPKPTSVQQQPPGQPPAAPGMGGGGFMSTIAEGFAFGAGSSIARHAVGSMLGGFGGGGSSDQGGGGVAPPPEQFDPSPSEESNYEWGGSDFGGDDSGGDDWT